MTGETVRQLDLEANPLTSSHEPTDQDQPLALGRVGLADSLLGGTERIPSGLDDVLLDLLASALLEMGNLLVEL